MRREIGRRTGVFRRILAAAFALILLLTAAVPALAADNRTVRVGIFSLGRFMGWDESGNACGYNIDFLENVATYTHWKYEYVACENWVDATARLENGEIDLLAPAQITEALSEKFSYAALYMGTEAAAIYTSAERAEIAYEDFETMKQLTFGVADGSTFAKKFVEEYCPEHDFVPATVGYANTTELMAGLENGEVDAVVTNIMFASDELHLLGWFSPLPVYYIAQKGNQSLLNEIDTAMMRMLVEEPGFTANLESTYFPVFKTTQFSHDELELVSQLPELTVGYEINHAPLSDQDAETGEFTGITRDLLDKIAQTAGLKFKYEGLPATGVSSEYLVEHNIQLLCNVEYNAVNASLRELHLSTPYLDSEKVLVASGDLQFDPASSLRIALSTGSGTLETVINATYPNFSFINFETVDECFDAVRSGEVDGTMQNRYVADCELQNPRYDELTVLPIQSLSDQLCMATLEFEGGDAALAELLGDGRFISVLDKAIQQITTDEMNSIIIENTANVRYHFSFADFLSRYRTPVLMIAVLLAACIALLIYVQRITSAKNRELEGKNVQLADAVAQADRASVAKSEFLSRMSHEIRTPMNAIVGLTTIARSHEHDWQKVDDYLTKIDTSSKVLLNIINDVLDMSAIESNKLKIGHSEFDIKQVLSGISTIYYPQCRSKGITFIMATDLENEILMGDSLRVNQILLNLVSNAYKFTAPGGQIRVFVKETAHRDQTAFLRFTVSDTGCGMSADMKERLFKPFEQESAATARKHGGSGLGLSIAKNLVDLMHGAIKVESEVGKGTTFHVDLPFGVVDVVSDFDEDKLKQIRILTVDDDPSAREYSSIVLGRIGVTFDTADSGAEALVKIEQAEAEGRPYEVCLIDWKMPDMDGIEVTRRIRARESHKALIIILSAYDLNEVEDEARAAGADQFITKPLFQSSVFNVLMTLSGGQLKKENAQPEDYDFGGQTVLLAEDNDMNAEIAAELLDMVNLKTERAEDGSKALEMFEAAAPGYYGAILMDVQMPVMDGYEASRAIRALKRPDAKTIQIFAMTANAFNEDVSSALSAGMNGHIAKPIDTEVLYSTLAGVLLKEKDK